LGLDPSPPPLPGWGRHPKKAERLEITKISRKNQKKRVVVSKERTKQKRKDRKKRGEKQEENERKRGEGKKKEKKKEGGRWF